MVRLPVPLLISPLVLSLHRRLFQPPIQSQKIKVAFHFFEEDIRVITVKDWYRLFDFFVAIVT